MQRSEALKRLRNILGKEGAYRVNPDAPSAEEREEAQQRFAGLKEQREAASKAMNERQRALLQGDAEYQRLREEYKQAEKVFNANNAKRGRYKFTVGVNRGMFFVVKAEGDSWEEIFAKLRKEQSK